MSIANNLDEAQKKVKELQDQLKDLTLEPSAIIDIGNLTKANNAINTLTKAVTAAKKEASEQNKKVLLVFSGSDWCGPCIKLDKNVWQSDAFKAESKKNWILIKADFPKKNNGIATPA